MYNLEPRITSAKLLPKGWEWRFYDDGSGGLYSPEDENVVEVDYSTSEYRYKGEWHFMNGYPYGTIDSDDFTNDMEESVKATIEREGISVKNLPVLTKGGVIIEIAQLKNV